MTQTILVTGGAGYIGSHTCLELLNAGYRVVVVDNLSNSKVDSLQRVQALTGQELTFHQADLRSTKAIKKIFRREMIDAVIHFAGLKAVGESTEIPLAYYQNNIGGTTNLLEAMLEFGCKNIVFSSSATVYGAPDRLPLTEDAPLFAVNPYGRTKLYIEHMLGDLAASNPDWRISILRYFNPVGAHDSGRIGEDPNGIPNNLMPYVAQVAAGIRPELAVFGDDYDTPDGSGVRDYIHVVDLAQAHLAALDLTGRETGVHAINVGTGRGYSVFEMVRAFEAASGRPVPYRVVARRPGDIAAVWADPTKAERELGWKATKTIEDMCRDAWHWQQKNPAGY